MLPDPIVTIIIVHGRLIRMLCGQIHEHISLSDDTEFKIDTDLVDVGIIFYLLAFLQEKLLAQNKVQTRNHQQLQ